MWQFLLLTQKMEYRLKTCISLALFLESGKSLVIALNKWDSVSEYEREKLKSDIDKKLPFVKFAEKVFISALNQDGFPILMKSIIKAHIKLLKQNSLHLSSILFYQMH